MDRLDPRSPLVLDTRTSVGDPGPCAAHATVEAPADLGTDVIAIPAGPAARAGPAAGVRRRGSARHRLGPRPRRPAPACGAWTRSPSRSTAHFQELFAYADRAAHHHEVGADDDEDEVRELVGDLIDLEPVLRDAVVPALPFQPVCRDDCPGLCSECGAQLAEDPDHHHDSDRPAVGRPAGHRRRPYDQR